MPVLELPLPVVPDLDHIVHAARDYYVLDLGDLALHFPLTLPGGLLDVLDLSPVAAPDAVIVRSLLLGVKSIHGCVASLKIVVQFALRCVSRKCKIICVNICIFTFQFKKSYKYSTFYKDSLFVR